MKRTISFVLTLLLFNTGWAMTSVGSIVKTRGEVEIQRENQNIEAKVGEKVYAKDRLVSSNSAYAKVLMNDDTILHLGPESELLIENFQMKTKKDREATYNILKGKVRSLFTVKSEKKTLEIKTPTASMGIRGTEFITEVFEEDNTLKTDVALLSGKIDVEILYGNFEKTDRMISMVPGQILNTGKRLTPDTGKDLKPRIKILPRKEFQLLKRPESKGGQLFLRKRVARSQLGPNLKLRAIKRDDHKMNDNDTSSAQRKDKMRKKDGKISNTKKDSLKKQLDKRRIIRDKQQKHILDQKTQQLLFCKKYPKRCRPNGTIINGTSP